MRELYRIPDSESLLFITTDRISCFDVVRDYLFAVASIPNHISDLGDRKIAPMFRGMSWNLEGLNVA